MNLLDKIKSFIKYPLNPKYSEQVIVSHPETTYPPAVIPTAEPVKPAEDPVSKRFLTNEPGRKILANKWNSQRDNKYSPSGACNVTAVQTLLSLDFPDVKDDDLFLLANSERVRQTIMQKFPQDYKIWIKPYFDKGNANEVYVCLIEAVRSVMGTDRFCRMETSLTAAKAKQQIDNGYGVFCSAKFGFNGHCVAVVGYDDPKGCWIVNDSWGNWMTGYKNINGDHVEYPYSKMLIPGYVSPYGILVHSDRRIPV